MLLSNFPILQIRVLGIFIKLRIVDDEPNTVISSMVFSKIAMQMSKRYSI